MMKMFSKVVHPARAVLGDAKGVETLEWILIGALIVGLGLVVYPGILGPSLESTVSGVGTAIQTQASGLP